MIYAEMKCRKIFATTASLKNPGLGQALVYFIILNWRAVVKESNIRRMSNCLQIGNVKLEVPVVLAPMAGYTDAAFRVLCRRFGCGLVFSEVVTAVGLTYGSKRTLHLLETVPGEKPVAAHIYGCEPAVMAEAARLIESLNRFDLIDINAGCPVRKIVAKGCGAALMKDPDKLRRIVGAVAGAVKIPVTVKTRIGFSAESMNVLDVAHAVEDGGASAVFIHTRFATMHHSGPADWDALSLVKAGVSIPVIGNGGIGCARDALDMMDRTGVDGVMIGRGAVGHPWIFDEVRCLLEGGQPEEISMEKRRRIVNEHIQLLMALKKKEYLCRKRVRLTSDESAVLHFRSHLYRYLSGLRGGARVKSRLNEMKTLEDLTSALDEVLNFL